MFGLRRPSPGVCRPYGRDNSDLQDSLFQGGPSSAPALCWAPADPHLHWSPPTLEVVLVQSPMGSLLLSSGSWCTQNFVCASKTGASISSSPLEVLKLNPTDPQVQISWRFPSPFVRSPGWEAWSGVQNLYNNGRTSLGLLFSSLWVTPPPSARGIWFYHDYAPSTVLVQLLCLWTWIIFFWWVPASSCWSTCCSTANCNHAALRGYDHMSFYSIILNRKPLEENLW